jgi:hypothetical protein
LASEDRSLEKCLLNGFIALGTRITVDARYACAEKRQFRPPTESCNGACETAIADLQFERVK